MNSKRSTRASNSRQKRSKPTRRSWKLIAIALYISFLLLSTIPFAADRTINTDMKETYEYHLRYPRDGRQTHYYVERANASQAGEIDLIYTTSTNSLIVDAKNIKVLHIYCRSMYEDECKKVFGIDPDDNSNYYKWYFIEKNRLTVSINADNEIDELSFIDTPKPYKVVVNGKIWQDGSEYYYTDASGIALSNVPAESTIVEIYFKSQGGTPPNAILNASRTLVALDQEIDFDASQSFDTDGTISTYILDFGDGTFRSGSKQTYQYSKQGTYGVILMVRDNDDLVDHAYVNITVVESPPDIPEIQGRVPDQVKHEDAPPWTLDLNSYEPSADNSDAEFYWYLTGEDHSLYTVTGENGTIPRFIFTPVPDAFGNNEATLWVTNNDDILLSQPLWINLTPVNDPPIIYDIPDLILHYDDPYIFNYIPYVNDKETPRHELTLEIFDGYEDNYIIINGLNATFNYPEKLVDENIFATARVSDGEAFTEYLFTILVTSDYVPELIEPLPDIWLFEGTTKYNVFDLDDYFTDPDNDAIYFTYGTTHLSIIINSNHTVDISAQSEWTGIELVTFRALDPIGALAEDMIEVTVLPVNDPPSIAGVPDFYVRYERDYRFELTPYVRDNDTAMDELSIIPSDLENIRIDQLNNMVIILNYPRTYLDLTFPIRLTVFDGHEHAFQDITVTVTEDFPPELIRPLPDVVLMEDVPSYNVLDLDNYFLDADGDVLFYLSGNNKINITINADHTVDCSAPRDWFGEELVYFRANDPIGAHQEDLVTVTVLPVNDAPVLLPLPEQYGNESERWVLDLEPYIYDVDNNITELVISLDCEYIAISGSNLIFFGTEELPGQIMVTVSDGDFNVSQELKVHVKMAKEPQTPTLLDLFINILPIIIMIIIIILVISGVVYRKKNRFIAEEIFLIHEGGILINHLSRTPQANVDDVIFSGMFTAVMEFIKDSFSNDDETENQWALDELKLGENNIMIERSENTYLAVIFSGEGSKRLRRIVNRLLDEIETKYAKVLSAWDGSINQLEGTKEILSVLIKVRDKPKEPSEQKVTFPIDEPTSKTMRTTKTTHMKRPKLAARSIESKAIASAQPVKPLKVPDSAKDEDKDLLSCPSVPVVASKPKFLDWLLNTSKGKISAGVELDKLTIALQINPERKIPKTIEIKDGRILSGNPSTPKAAPANLDMNTLRTVNIAMPGCKKTLNIDRSKSLFQQLADFEDKN